MVFAFFAFSHSLSLKRNTLAARCIRSDTLNVEQRPNVSHVMNVYNFCNQAKTVKRRAIKRLWNSLFFFIAADNNVKEFIRTQNCYYLIWFV